MLTWLKLWDECVFNRKPSSFKKKNDKDLSEQSQIATKFQERSDAKFRKKFPNKFDADELSTELDEYKRPENKVCGSFHMESTFDKGHST